MTTDRRPWGVHDIRSIYSPNVMAQYQGDGWAYAVCEPYTGNRLQAAWWVLTGRAFAFVWPKVGHVEQALGIPFWHRGPNVNNPAKQAKRGSTPNG